MLDAMLRKAGFLTVVQVCDVTIDGKLIATQAVAVLNPKL